MPDVKTGMKRHQGTVLHLSDYTECSHFADMFRISFDCDNENFISCIFLLLREMYVREGRTHPSSVVQRAANGPDSMTPWQICFSTNESHPVQRWLYWPSYPLPPESWCREHFRADLHSSCSSMRQGLRCLWQWKVQLVLPKGFPSLCPGPQQ